MKYLILLLLTSCGASRTCVEHRSSPDAIVCKEYARKDLAPICYFRGLGTVEQLPCDSYDRYAKGPTK